LVERRKASALPAKGFHRKQLLHQRLTQLLDLLVLDLQALPFATSATVGATFTAGVGGSTGGSGTVPACVFTTYAAGGGYASMGSR